ncbi:MAG TPA: DUF6766 family protein [Microthrixaceae bacterium]|nr:DUF6766 family protein [Microthrixaceae bacterium]
MSPWSTEAGSDRRSSRSAWVRNSKLGLACFGLFILFLVAQSVTGWRSYDADQTEHGEATVSYPSYLTTGHFAEATFENWESEFLQMGAFVVLTAFLIQKGSSESKQEHDDPHDEDPRFHRDDPDAPWPVRRGGWWLGLYEHSLFIAFVILFLGSMLGHAVGGAAEYSSEQVAHGQPAVSVWGFVRTSQFWFESFQNWQSEFLAVASIVVLTIFLRQRGSPESKPVHESVDATGS